MMRRKLQRASDRRKEKLKDSNRRIKNRMSIKMTRKKTEVGLTSARWMLR